LDNNFIAWHYSKSYTFSVRSAYHLEWNHQFGQKVRRADGQGSVRDNPSWDIPWKLTIPSKVKKKSMEIVARSGSREGCPSFETHTGFT
jgi:hypothetical protein